MSSAVFSEILLHPSTGRSLMIAQPPSETAGAVIHIESDFQLRSGATGRLASVYTLEFSLTARGVPSVKVLSEGLGTLNIAGRHLTGLTKHEFNTLHPVVLITKSSLGARSPKFRCEVSPLPGVPDGTKKNTTYRLTVSWEPADEQVMKQAA
jgi:hypothetical protein